MEKCKALNCFYNNDGSCMSCDDLHNPELEDDCISYLDDIEED